jgi:serine/threonine-protein kinase
MLSSLAEMSRTHAYTLEKQHVMSSPGTRHTPLRLAPASRALVGRLRHRTGDDSASRSLPSDFLEQSRRRVSVASLVIAALWFVCFVTINVLRPMMDGPATKGTFPGDPTSNALMIAGTALALGVALIARHQRLTTKMVIDIGLGSEVLTALLIALIAERIPVARTSSISWVCVPILLYPMIAPSSVRRILLAGFAAASTELLVMLCAPHFGAPLSMTSFSLFWTVFPGYLCAVAAIVPARIIGGLGRQVRRGREMGSYRVGTLIARGGMGEVYEAHHRLLARPAAIKLIRPEILRATSEPHARRLAERFHREAAAAARLRSPHTIHLYDFDVAEDGTLFYVMELLEGLDLNTLVRRFGPLPPERVVYLLRQACESLAEAHASGIIHRDIKPSNLCACRLGRKVDFVKVLDFGLVRFEESEEHDMALTAPGMQPLGTPGFMAPEVLLSGRYDRRVDVYALGCVAYWLLTGQYVFTGEHAIQLLAQHISETPIQPSLITNTGIPDALDDIVLRCLAKDPEDRPSDGEELLGMLMQCETRETWDEQRARRWWAMHLPAEAARGGNAAPLAPAA